MIDPKIDKNLVKLAYMLGYKQAAVGSLFKSDGGFDDNFLENMATQQRLDNPWVLGSIAAGGGYMALHSLKNPGSKKNIAALESKMHRYWGSRQRPGLLNDLREAINPGSGTAPSLDPKMVRFRHKIRNLKLKKYPGIFKRVGKAGLWGSLAAAAAAALAYRNDWI